MDNNKRFVLDFEEGFIIDELVGVKYPVCGDYKSAEEICELINRENERANRNAELILDTDFHNPYQLFWRLTQSCDDLQEQIEQDIRKYIKENWSKDVEFYVELHLSGCIEITVFDKALDVKEFEQVIINRLLEMYTLKINGLETYMAQDEYSYFEWHLGNVGV